MTSEEHLYREIGDGLLHPSVQAGALFGKPCYKVNGKAFISLFNNCMVFKLTGQAHAEAVGLAGAERFDPSGKGRPMKEWVQVPFTHAGQWKRLAEAALAYVGAA